MLYTNERQQDMSKLNPSFKGKLTKYFEIANCVK
jgi:hypothetical protein